MMSDTLFLDSSRQIVKGKATIDFKTNKVDALLVPQLKNPEMLSLNPPIHLKGTFQDFSVGMPAGDLLKNTVLAAASVVTAPLDFLVGSGTDLEDFDETRCAAAIESSPRPQ